MKGGGGELGPRITRFRADICVHPCFRTFSVRGGHPPRKSFSPQIHHHHTMSLGHFSRPQCMENEGQAGNREVRSPRGVRGEEGDLGREGTFKLCRIPQRAIPAMPPSPARAQQSQKPSFPWIFVHSLQQAGQQVGPVAGYLAGLRWAARPPMGRTGEGGHTGSGQGCRQAPGPLGYRSTLAQPYPAPRPRGGPPTLAQPREPTGGPGTGGLGRVGGGRPQGSWLSQRGAGVSRPEACRRAIRERQP